MSNSIPPLLPKSEWHLEVSNCGKYLVAGIYRGKSGNPVWQMFPLWDLPDLITYEDLERFHIAKLKGEDG